MRSQRGFTLAEAILVLVLTGILGAVALPRMTGQSVFAALAAHDFVAASLRHAQKSAVAMRRNVCVALSGNALAITFAAQAGASQACSPALRLPNPANGLPYDDVANRLPGGAVAAAAASLAFDGLGRPQVSPGVPLTTALTLQIANHASAISVEPTTGTVH